MKKYVLINNKLYESQGKVTLCASVDMRLMYTFARILNLVIHTHTFNLQVVIGLIKIVRCSAIDD